MYSVIGSDGQVYGPATMDVLRQWCQEGRINSQTNMIDPLDGRVLRAREVPGLDDYFAATAAPPLPPLPGTMAAPYAPVQPPRPGNQFGQAPIQTNNYLNSPSSYQNPPSPYQYQYPPVPYSAPRSKIAAILLAFFLGAFGAHRFYMGHTSTGTAMLLITVLTCGYGSIITGIWAIVDLIMIASGSLLDAEGQPLT